MKMRNERYLNDAVDNFINGFNPVSWRRKINQDI